MHGGRRMALPWWRRRRARELTSVAHVLSRMRTHVFGATHMQISGGLDDFMVDDYGRHRIVES